MQKPDGKRAVAALVLLPLLWLAALGSADPVVYEQAERSQTPTTVGAGGLFGNDRSFFDNSVTLLPGQLGVVVANLSGPDQLYFKRQSGAVVERVIENSPAARAGLLRNDVILAVDDKPITVAADVSATLQGTTLGQQRKIRILRDKTEQVVTVTF